MHCARQSGRRPSCILSAAQQHGRLSLPATVSDRAQYCNVQHSNEQGIVLLTRLHAIAAQCVALLPNNLQSWRCGMLDADCYDPPPWCSGE